MRSFKFVFLYGFLVWLIPFIVAVLIFPIRENDRPLFESIMPVVVTLSVVLFSHLYFKKVGTAFVREGTLLGVTWFLISVIIDLLLFSSGPMKMGFVDYFKDIGLTYVIIPSITIGSGFLIQSKIKTETT
ncbi:MAG: hypothetical protein HY707_09120 [Ignavibacteriae bacterium]|nr:hypothetical protein [Ignavibacteriota bacterium]